VTLSVSSFFDGVHSGLGTALDPLGIGRRAAGFAPDQMPDWLASGSQSQVPDYGLDDGTAPVDYAPQPDDVVPDWLPIAGSALVGMVIIALFAYSVGQLFTAEVSL
jgi:hypothetical protein